MLFKARKVKAMKHKGKFNIKAMEKVEEKQKKIWHCRIYSSGHDSFEVKEKKSSFIVNMLQRTCICRRWKMSGFPCRHALKVISEKKYKQEDYMADCYLTSKWRKPYETLIESVRGANFWEETDEAGIVPPPIETEASKGRKKIPKRIKGRNEFPSKKKTKDMHESPTKVSRKRRVIHCGRCGESGHNTRKYQNVGVAIQRPPKKKNVSQDRSDFVEGSSQQMQSQVID